jgi:hypothetical protein
MSSLKATGTSIVLHQQGNLLFAIHPFGCLHKGHTDSSIANSFFLSIFTPYHQIETHLQSNCNHCTLHLEYQNKEDKTMIKASLSLMVIGVLFAIQATMTLINEYVFTSNNNAAA